jgi:ADP-heptose:LPS heptosyltransferase
MHDDTVKKPRQLEGKRIVVFCLPGIGDALMATPMIRVLHRKGARVDVAVMFDSVRYVFKNNDNVDSVHYLPLLERRNMAALSRLLSLRGMRYHGSLLAFPAYRREYHLVQWLVGAQQRIAHRFAEGHVSELHFLNTHFVHVDEAEHNVINNLNLLRPLGIEWQRELPRDDIRYDLILDEADVTFGRAYISNLNWENELIVGIHPGSTNSPAALLRRWPLENYASLIRFLIGRRMKVLIFAGPDEADIADRLHGLVSDGRHCRLIENVKFSQALGILNAANLLICNDNGFGHIAVALGKRILTLWASTRNTWSLPFGKELVTLIRPEGFAPWYRYELKRRIPEGARGGMEDISVQEVIRASARLLKTGDEPATKENMHAVSRAAAGGEGTSAG